MDTVQNKTSAGWVRKTAFRIRVLGKLFFILICFASFFSVIRAPRNWRAYLRVGMTRTEIRQLFGEAEKINVDLETWEYGSGEINFVVEKDNPDGSLYSWFEPD